MPPGPEEDLPARADPRRWWAFTVSVLTTAVVCSAPYVSLAGGAFQTATVEIVTLDQARVSPPPGPPAACRPPLMVGHRGHPGAGVTEDTIASFEAARKLGARAVEFDVHIDADNRFVVMHDSTVARTTDGHGWVSAMSSSQIRRLRTPKGQRVPFLSDVLAWGKAHRIHMLLEIKYDTSRAWTRHDLMALVALVKHRRLTGDVTFFSLRREYVSLIERAAPHQDTAWIVDGRPRLRRAASVDMVMLYASVVSPRLVASLGRVGVRTGVRRNNDPRAVYRMAAAGVWGVVTDRLLPDVDFQPRPPCGLAG